MIRLNRGGSSGACWTLAAVVAVAPSVAAAHAGGTYTFTNIADNTGELGNSFSTPAINNHGVVVFAASIGGGATGIFTGDGGPLTPIADDAGDLFDVGTFPGINDRNLVVLRASDNISDTGIYTGDGRPLSLIADNSGSPFISVSLPAINNAGEVTLHGTMTGGVMGVYRAAGFGSYTTIADTSGEFVSFGGLSVLNDDGVVAILANSDTTSGIYLGDGGPLTPIVDTSGEFTSLGSSPSVNNAGIVAFFAGNANRQGVYTGDGGPITPIADSDGPFAPFTFNDICINNRGDVAFFANLDTGERGIFTGGDPQTDTVIKTGDTLFGSTLTFLPTLIGPRAINDDGGIAFAYILADGRQGVAVATPGGGPTEPADLNGDGSVDVVDLLDLLAAWGPCPQPCPPSCAADLNGNCAVDIADLLDMLAAWSP